MKPSNQDIDGLWQDICFAHEQAGKRIPRCWRLIYRAVHRLFAWKARRGA